MSILNFNKSKNEFEFNKEFINKLSENSKSGNLPSFRDYSNNLFGDKKYIIFKNFLDKDVVLKLKEYYSKENINSFEKVSSMYRSYYYLNSPFVYPKLIESLIINLMEFKNYIYQYHEYYQNYCLKYDLNPQDFASVAQNQILHTWRAVYLYKDGCKFDKHIDYYGELACFLILSEKGKDYQDGGLEITYDNGKKIVLDDEYNYGDVVFFDQASTLHKVKEIKTNNLQIGRLQLYIPTIPSNYMSKKLFFEGSKKPYFTTKNISFLNKRIEYFKSLFTKNKIHFTRIKKPHKNFEL